MSLKIHAILRCIYKTLKIQIVYGLFFLNWSEMVILAFFVNEGKTDFIPYNSLENCQLIIL